MDDELSSYQRASTGVTHEAPSALHTPALDDLLGPNLKMSFEIDLEIQSKSLAASISAAKQAFQKTTPTAVLSDDSFSRAVPSWSLHVLPQLGSLKIDSLLLDRVIFIRIVGPKIFLSLADLKLVIFDKGNDTATTEILSNPLTAMDYDQPTDSFVFGFKNGRVQLARFDSARRHLIFDDTNINEFSSRGAVSVVKMVSRADVILVLTNTNNAFFLTRTHPTKPRFSGFQLLDGSKRVETFDDVSAVRVQDQRMFGGRDAQVLSTFIVTVSSATVVFFVRFETVYQGTTFSEIREGSLKILTKLDFPSDFKDRMAPVDSPQTPPVRLTELGLVSAKRTFVIPSPVQWMAESSPAFYIIWENIIQRFELSAEGPLIPTLTTSVPLPLVCAFLGSIEYLVCLNSDFELNLIHLHKVRHHVEIPSLAEMPEVFSRESLFTKTDRPKVICGHDLLSQGFATLNASFLQCFEVMDWEDYLEKLLDEKQQAGVLKVLQDIVRLNPVPLHGVANCQGQMRCPTDHNQEEVRLFCKELSEFTPVLITSVLESLTTTDPDAMATLLEVAIEVLQKTNTFRDVALALVEAAIAFQERVPGSDLPVRFFIALEQLFLSSRVLDTLDSNFFIFLFRFTKFEGMSARLEQFLISLVSRSALPDSVIFPLKMSACNKHLYNFLFFILIVDPDLETNLGQLGQLMTELRACNPKDVDTYLAEILIFIYDLFTDRILFAVCGAEAFNFTPRQALVSQWLLQNAEALFMDVFATKTMYLLHKIFRPLPRENTGPPVVVRSRDANMCYSESLNQKLGEAVKSIPPAYGLSVFLLSFLLLPGNFYISQDFVFDLYRALLQGMAAKSAPFRQVDQTTLEFAVLKLQGAYTAQLERLAVFPESPDPFLATLHADLNGRMEEALTQIMDKPYFYWVCQNRIETATPVRAKSIAGFLKTNMVLLNARGSASFQQLIRALPTEHIISFAEQFKNDPALQLRILQSLESSQLNNVTDKEVSRVYLRLICQLEPRRVTAVLRTNNRLDINEKMQICQESRCARGEAYCLKKISNFEESQRIYLGLLQKIFGFSRSDVSDSEKTEVLELANEILEDLWEEEARRTLRELVVFICDHSRGVRQTSDLLRPLLGRLFNYDVLELLHDFKKFSHWPSMMTSRALFEQLSSNYRTIDYINFNIKSIIETQNDQDKALLREASMRGKPLVIRDCFICGKFKNETASEIRFHTCSAPVHDSCQIDVKSFSCQACALKNLG